MNHAVFQLKNVHFWSNVVNEIRHWWAQVTFQGHHGAGASDARPVTIRNVKNTWPSLSSSFLLLPSPFPFSSFFPSWPPKTPQFLGKNAKIVIMMSIFDPTRGSYSLGRVLLRRNTLYTKMFGTRISAGATEKLPEGENLTQKQSRGPPARKDTRKNALRDNCELANKKWSSKTMCQVLASMITCSSRKNFNQLEHVQRYAHKLFWNASTWHEVVGLFSFFCQQTCKSSDKMDKSMWQTFSSFDFIHSSHQWLPKMLSCG